MLLGIGIDILSLPRLEALISRRGAQPLARRICCPRELIEFRDSPNPAHTRFLGSKWALKEAAYKSLPPNFMSTKLTWKALDVGHSDSGAPTLRLAESQGIGVDFMVSLSGDAGLLVAVVVARKTADT